MDHRALISELVGESYPVAVETANGRLRRNWLVRTTHDLPDASTLAAIEHRLSVEILEAIKEAYADSAAADKIEQSRPRIELIPLDPLHLVVRIEFAAPSHAVGDAAMISQWGALQRLDRDIKIAELQRIPRSFWFALRP